MKYYTKPKIGLNRTQDNKYGINLPDIDNDNIYTFPPARDQDIDPIVNNTTPFPTFYFTKFNRFFDINDYQRINQLNSLLPDDQFNTRLYDTIMMTVLNKFNIEFI
jgi:hypothetical protein